MCIYLKQTLNEGNLITGNNIQSFAHLARTVLLRGWCHTSLKRVNNGNRTEWSPIRSVIIRVIKKIGRPRSESPMF